MYKYDLEINSDYKSLTRVHDLLSHLYDIMMLQQRDSFEGITGGASPHLKIKFEVKEEWI